MNWLFAYGSLLPAGQSKLPQGVVPCSLVGWQRSWGVAMDNTVDLPGYKHYRSPDGTRPRVMVAFLDVALAADTKTNGIVLPLDSLELPGLDARERNYCRVDVTGQLDRSFDGCVWTYVGLPAARERAVRGARDGRLVASRSYLERVLDGFDLLGGRKLFEASTFGWPPLAELEVIYAVPPAWPRSAISG